MIFLLDEIKEAVRLGRSFLFEGLIPGFQFSERALIAPKFRVGVSRSYRDISLVLRDGPADLLSMRKMTATHHFLTLRAAEGSVSKGEEVVNRRLTL